MDEIRPSGFAHLTLPELRTYRHALDNEEIRVSYWRRLIQARADVTRAGGGIGIHDASSLKRVLTNERGRRVRTAMLREVPIDDSPPLPDLEELWSRLDGDDDEGGRILLLEDLMAVEARLSAYRRELHERLDAATAELISRYRAEPTLCLAVLPLTGGGRQ